MKLSIKEQIAQARSRIKENKSKGGGGGESFWLSSDKPAQVRALPEIIKGKPDFEQLFLREVTMWSIPGHKDMVIDPESLGIGESPMMPLYKELKDANDPSNKKLLSWFKPKSRWFMRLVRRRLEDDGTTVIEDENPEAKYYYAPMDIADEFLRLYDDPDYGTVIVDPYDGIDFTFLKSGKGLNTEYSADPRRKQTPLFSSKEMIDKFLSELPTLDEKLESLVLPVEKLEEMVETMDISKVESQGSGRKGSGKIKSRNMSDEDEPDEEDADIDGEEEKEEKPSRPSSSSLRERMSKRISK